MDKVTAFDALFTNNQIQKLKILISYVDSPLQRQLAIYIKFLELKYTMDLFRNYPELSVSPQQQEPPEPARILQEISPYCNDQEQKQLNQLLSMLQAMSHYQEIMDMVQMFQEMFPDGMPFTDSEASEGSAGNGAPSDCSASEGSIGKDNVTDDGFFGSNSDMMAAGLGNLFGGNMPDLSQLMSMMNMLQSMNSSHTDSSTEDN